MSPTDEVARTGDLSIGQRALWFLQKLAPQSAAYNTMWAAKITPGVDLDALRRALQRLVDRHPGLRTTFPLLNGKPVQRIHQWQRVSFRQRNVSSLSWERLMEEVANEAHRPFNLEQDQLIRADLFTRSPEDHVLLLTAHHIIVDFHSCGIILDELRAIYAAETSGREASLPPIEFDYLDYVDRQTAMLSDKRGEELFQYWKGQLSGGRFLLDAPTDHPRQQFQTFRGSDRAVTLASDLTVELRRFASANGIDLYQLLTSAFLLLLHKFSEQDDIVIGYTSANKRESEFERVVGFFHNPVAIRSRISGDPSLRSFLRQTARTISAALDHRDYPLSLLVERLHLDRQTNRSPLFQAMFVFYEIGAQSPLTFITRRKNAFVKFGEAELHPVEMRERSSMMDLRLTVVDDGDALSASLQYDTDLFESRTAAKILSEFMQLMRVMAADPSADISQLRKADRAAHQGSDSCAAGERGLNPADVRENFQLGAGGENDLAFSLFYFSSSDEEASSNKYKLLLEGAKYADRNGFSAVWTPERHFHQFGGIYPNPSITSAALSTVTDKIQLRAGSVVSPLHNPIRLAEDWSVIDNLSNGRVGVSFASGWNASDFVFAPNSYQDRRAIMERDIETVRRLWRGEKVSFEGGAGNQVSVKILPRPIQAELPVWVTAFGNPETFRLAGKIGAHLLTHLLGQSVELLAEKIALYRSAWIEHRHRPEGGIVTVMLHTFIDSDDEVAREKTRAPFCNYLKSSFDLLAGFAKEVDLRVDPRHLSNENRDAIVDYAFNRYYKTCALLGTPASCLPLLDRLKAAGVNEIACLIDFGIDDESTLSGLEHLKDLLEATRGRRIAEERPCGSTQPYHKGLSPEPAGSLGPSQDNEGGLTVTFRVESGTAARFLSREELRMLVADVWRQALGIEDVKYEDDFYEIGGNPLLQEKVRTILQKQLNRNIPWTEFSSCRTANSIVDLLSNQSEGAALSKDVQSRAEARRTMTSRHKAFKRPQN